MSQVNIILSHFGSIINVAKSLGITKHAVYFRDPIPYPRACQIQVITNGHIKADDIKNDSFLEYFNHIKNSNKKKLKKN